jgi:general L-amino acid transport system permease protein
VRGRDLALQAVLLGALVLLGFWITGNARANLESRHVGSGFDFLFDPAGFDIAESLVDYRYGDSYLRAFAAGMVNTLSAAVPAIIGATLIGFLLGVCAVARHPLLRGFARMYVDTVRNLPLLVQVLLWYFSLTELLPDAANAISLRSAVFVSKAGLSLPLPAGNVSLLTALAGSLALAVGAAVLARRAFVPGGRLCLATLTAIMLWWFVVPALTGRSYQIEYPQQGAYGFSGPLTFSPEYVALVGALTFYSAAYISEIVRAGIRAVPRGQSEGAYALSLTPTQTLMRVVLPQALRVIMPPYTSQFVNTIKNSSLAVAIGYQDIVSVGSTAMSQNGRAIECVAIIAAVYLSISLTASLVLNAYNLRVRIRER